MASSKRLIRSRSFAFLALLSMAGSIGPAAGQVSSPSAAGTSPTALPTVTSWQHAGSDIPADPAWRTGTLPNGVRYVVRHNAMPSGTASIRVRMDVGALMEADSQQGWAHLVEHMVFRGTPTMGDGEGVRIWQRMGASFGTDSNALTTLNATTYKLDLPKADADAIGTATGILADMMQNATIDPKSLDVEREVVLAERALRLTPLNQEFRDATDRAILPGLLAAKRNIVGNAASLSAATAASLHSFYRRWYRPERAVVVIVGDADASVLEDAVRKAFGGWLNESAGPSEPDFGKLGAAISPAVVVSDPQAPNLIEIVWPVSHDERPWTLARVQQSYIDTIATGIVGQRMAIEARSGGAIVEASMGNGHSRHGVDQISIRATPNGGAWQAALDRVFAITNGALAAAPSQGEIDQQLARMKEDLTGLVTYRETERSGSLADTFINDVDTGNVSADRTYYRDAFEALQSTIKPAIVSAALRRLLAPYPRLVVASKAPIQGGDAAVRAALTGALKVAAATQNEVRSVSIDELKLPGPAAEPISVNQVPELGVERVHFANGVELVLKKTAIENNSIRLLVTIGHGVLNQDQREPVLSWSSGALLDSGLGPFSADEMTKLSSGRQMDITVRPTFKSLWLSSQTYGGDLADTLRLMTGMITQPHFAESSVQRLKNAYDATYQTLFSQPGSVLGAFGDSYAFRGDKRFCGLPDPSSVKALTLEAFKAYWSAKLGEGPIKIVVVGDFTRSTVIDAVGASFGALPPRRDHMPNTAQLDILPSLPQAKPIILHHRGAANQAIVMRVWPTTGAYADMTETRALRLAASIIQTRLIEGFREKSGGTYAPFASSNTSDDLPRYGTFNVGVQLRVDRIQDFEATLDAAVSDLSVRGVDADALARARAPVISAMARAKSSNNEFWLAFLSRDLDDQRVVDGLVSAEAGYAAITPAQIQAAVVKYLRPGGSYEVRVLPGG